MTLRLVHAREVPCWPWELRALELGPALQAYCRPCGREVALPADHQADRPVCLYCAMDSGLLPAADLPLGEALA